MSNRLWLSESQKALMTAVAMDLVVVKHLGMMNPQLRFFLNEEVSTSVRILMQHGLMKAHWDADRTRVELTDKGRKYLGYD